MEIYLNTQNNYNLPLYNNLCLLKENDFFSREHVPSLPEPADIYQNCIEEILVSLKILNESLKKSQIENIRCDLRNYLQVINNFNDNLFLIIKSLTPPPEKDKKAKNVKDWLKNNNNKKGSIFDGYANLYKKDLIYLINKVKHDTTFIEDIELKRITNNSEILIKGFYVAVVNEENKIIPDNEIHKVYHNNVHTAFSFNHFIKRTIAFVFISSYNLNRVLFNGKKTKKFDRKYDSIYALFNEAIKIPNIFFPDEYLKPTPNFIVRGNKLVLENNKKFKDTEHSTYNISKLIKLNPRTSGAAGAIPYINIGK